MFGLGSVWGGQCLLPDSASPLSKMLFASVVEPGDPWGEQGQYLLCLGQCTFQRGPKPENPLGGHLGWGMLPSFTTAMGHRVSLAWQCCLRILKSHGPSLAGA